MYQEPIEIKKISLNKFCQTIEEIIDDLVKESHILNWDEDYITRKFLSQLSQNLSGSLISDLENKAVFLSPFKLSKPVEYKFGDIAIIVNIEYGDGDSIQGIGFLEAKRKYKASRNFDAIDWNQLERIFNNAPHSQLLLYDFRDISEFAPTGLVAKKNATSGSPMNQLPVTKFVSAPINKTLQVKKKNESLYKLSLPFSYQLAYRYLNGFDLEYSNDILNIVKTDFAKNYENLDLEIPEYIIYIDIIPDKKLQDVASRDKEKKRLVKFPINDIDKNIYLPIKSEK